ncbi:MAG: phosphate ABC transporter permease PstA [Actinobacteria bacterium]|nr:phosphate ABC transporter permease PstA [Actinomycetota bacterium]MDA2985239.1 phosphate ABC transporter permease PstA [Actinomycetota bacterium]
MSQTISLKKQISIRRVLIDAAFRTFLYFSIFTALGMIFWVVSRLWSDAGWLLSWDLITNYPSYNIDDAGFQSPLVGSLWVVGFATLMALPTGVLTALYLEHFAGKSNKLTRLIELNVQNLAGVPAVVFGLIGLAFIVRGFVKWGFTVGSAAVVIAMLILPVIIIVSREAIRSVPPSYKEGALALGATNWQAVWRLVLPSAIPGTATGSILAISRAIGESAPLLLLGALSFVTFNPTGLDSPFTIMPLTIFKYASDSREEYQILASAGSLILVAVLFTLNLTAILLRDFATRKRNV